MAQHNELGKKGEALAVEYLLKNSYEILETNYRFQKSEVDIIAKKGTTLAVVEVKTRSTDAFGDPQDFINPKKIKLLISAIDHYVIDRDLDIEVRFDIIAIVKQKDTFQIEHLKDAFLHF